LTKYRAGRLRAPAAEVVGISGTQEEGGLRKDRLQKFRMFVGFGQNHVPFRKIWLFVTDAQIAILCGIGQASSFDDEKRGEVESGGSWLRRKGRGPF
jgi:hypothetical protein